MYDCEGDCSADTRGDGSCDVAFECLDSSWDDGDCDAPSCGEVDLGSEVGEVSTGPVEDTWKSLYDGDCGGSGGIETSFTWTAPSTGTYCIDSIGSGFDTVLRVFDGLCVEELTCDDDGGGSLTSQLEYDATAAEAIVIMVDSYSSTTGHTDETGGPDSYFLNIVAGGCY